MNAKLCWPLFTSLMIALVVMDTKTRAYIQDPERTMCFRCLPSGDPKHDVAIDCDNVRIILCQDGTTSCATTLATPNLTSDLICVKDMPHGQPCSLLYSKETQTYNITCGCRVNYCTTHFSSDLAKNLTKFAAVNTVKEGQLISHFLKFVNLTHLPSDRILPALMNQTQNLTYHPELYVPLDIPHRPRGREEFKKTAIRLVLAGNDNETVTPQSDALQHDLRLAEEHSEHLPKSEALKSDAAALSDDDEDDGEGSGADDDARAHKRPPASPAAPSSYLPAKGNQVLHNYFTFSVPFFIYMCT